MVLGWGELQDEDRPPQQIWLDNEELEVHFERVRARWKNPSESPDMEAIDDQGSTANEYTQGLRERLKG